MESFFVFVHKHKVSLAIAKKKSNKCYSIDGYYQRNLNDRMKLTNTGFFYIYCQNCKRAICQSQAQKEFKVSQNKMEGLCNYFDKNGKLESVYKEEEPHKNLINDENYQNLIFYQLFPDTNYDNSIYIGTEEEKMEYFHKNYISIMKEKDKNELERQNKIIDLEKKEKAFSEFSSGILFKGDEQGEDAYDIIININSILLLNKEGWKIKYPNGKNKYMEKSKKKSILMGVVGNKNKGKSFILGKLSNYNIPKGFSITTEGISVRYGDKEDHCVAILDSAGQETPLLDKDILLLKNNKKEEKEDKILDDENQKNKDENKLPEINEQTNFFETSLRDKLITEAFIQQFIIHTAHILILVVGAITLNEQKLLERIKKSLAPSQFLYVIHNLQNLQSKEQVNDYIENTLKKLFGIEIEENTFQNNSEDYHQKYYVEKGNNNQITHLILVNDYSSIANYYNHPTITFLQKKLEVEEKRLEFSIVEECKKYFAKINHDFLVKEIKETNFLQDENKIILSDKEEIILRKVYIDEIGKTLTNYSDQPNYNYYIDKNDFIINIELPGENPICKTKVERGDGFYKFCFIGTKPGNNANIEELRQNSKVYKNLKGPTNFEFDIRIPLGDINILPNDKGKTQYYYRSDQDEELKDKKNGIITFKYHTEGNDAFADYE